jgi:hypothetical protein
VKTCSCGAAYNNDDWAELPIVGIQKLESEHPLELRNCRQCRSTMAVPYPRYCVHVTPKDGVPEQHLFDSPQDAVNAVFGFRREYRRDVVISCTSPTGSFVMGTIA